MKFTVLAMALAAMASGCGRYEGIPEPAFHSTLDVRHDDQTVTREEPQDHPEERTLRVIVRDIDEDDVYDENCRMLAPPTAPADWFEKYGQKLRIIPKWEANPSESSGSTFEIPVNAQTIPDGCQAPAVLVRVPYSEEFNAWVTGECCGLFDPEKPFYPDTFHVPWTGPDTPTPTLILFE